MLRVDNRFKNGISYGSVAIGRPIRTQGEVDSKAQNSDVYIASLNDLKTQLEQDFERNDINYIIGRLSDSGFYRRRDKKGSKIRAGRKFVGPKKLLLTRPLVPCGSIPMILMGENRNFT